ncbi:MAG: divergent polysaccharide deacetylase family protein [candidate division KSB1 bacterium]|nr:divergent polysaccharide deacetylase family protein [candidate division KSB1 bacterium]MDQ7064133.1 divergent polysaccharide deacetylase family protein [candidate division KSB1 bacterium]
MARRRRRTQKPPRHRFSLGSLIILLLLAGAVGAWFKVRPNRLDWFGSRSERLMQIRQGVQEQFARMGLQPVLMPGSRTMVINVPGNVHPLVIYQQISAYIEKAGGYVQGEQNRETGALTFSYGIGRRLAERVRLVPDRSRTQPTGKIAIIIDDFGYKRSAVVDALIDYPVPLTYAVIPGLAKSEEIARELHERGKTVIIHLPMEPMQGRVENDGFTLFTDLQPEEIRQRVRKAIEAVPYAVGLNNHMGSKATLDSMLLTAAFEEIARAGYFFVDSRTNLKSIAFDLARQMGLPALQNALFLDAVNDSARVVAKLMRLARLAEQNGEAVGIGHPRKNTLAAMNEVVPMLQVRGFEFVTVDQLLKQVSASALVLKRSGPEQR